jgi:LmbE family N-acetylglucosaminyl deacetylase
MLKLLCTTAHPDDEVWAFGGSLLRYREQGIETYVICLTRGQAATNRGGAASAKELGEMRAQEFYEACRLLKVTRATLLDYPDGALDQLDFKKVAAEMTRHIREIRPQVILTLGPEGTVTAHVDHAMVGLFTTAAYHWAGRTDRFPEQLKNDLTPHRADKLYYVTSTETWPERQPVSLPPVMTRIDVRKYKEAKVAAFRAHRSQLPLIETYGDRTLHKTEELFHLAASAQARVLPADDVETDLFCGMGKEKL